METRNVIEIITKMYLKMEEEKSFLTDLDNAIADGDHGINMARGFEAAVKKLEGFENKDIGTVLKTAGITLVSTVGGSAGPLYGTAFMKAGAVTAGKNSMDMNDFLSCMKAAVDGIKMRGRAVYGEKTMLDSMIPALDAMEKAYSEGLSAKASVEAGVKAAEDGVEFTKTIAATKGRASYIGERSIGHQDPGATSFTYLLDVIAKAL